MISNLKALLIILLMVPLVAGDCPITYHVTGHTKYEWCWMPCMPPSPDVVNVRIVIPGKFEQTFITTTGGGFWNINFSSPICFSPFDSMLIYVDDTEGLEATPWPTPTTPCQRLDKNNATDCFSLVLNSINNRPLPRTTTTTIQCEAIDLYHPATLLEGDDMNVIAYFTCPPVTVSFDWRERNGNWNFNGWSWDRPGVMKAEMFNRPSEAGSYTYRLNVAFVWTPENEEETSHRTLNEYDFRVYASTTTSTSTTSTTSTSTTSLSTTTIIPLTCDTCYLWNDNDVYTRPLGGSTGYGFHHNCPDFECGIIYFKSEFEHENGDTFGGTRQTCAYCESYSEFHERFKIEGWWRAKGTMSFNGKTIEDDYAYIYVYSGTSEPEQLPDVPSEFGVAEETTTSTTTSSTTTSSSSTTTTVGQNGNETSTTSTTVIRGETTSSTIAAQESSGNHARIGSIAFVAFVFIPLGIVLKWIARAEKNGN